ncbi:MAG TPA: hypothetical protein VMT70_24100 [Vicinamibacteria bacterium]|nr:hypothetical protein [Vicinamibacteria bacterium]
MTMPFLTVAMLLASPAASAGQGNAAQVLAAVRRDVSPPLRTLMESARLAPVVAGLNREVEDRLEKGVGGTTSRALDRDPLVDTSNAFVPNAALTPAPSLSFDGTSDDDNAAVVGFRVVPPDTNGAVGLGHYVQMNNLVLEIFDKATGTSLAGPSADNVLWAGFGGLCQTNNEGDPIVLYDHLADRWVFSQFAHQSGGTDGHQCFAVSTTPDPTGPYFRYDFFVSPGMFNDYPKIGVWPDAYYVSFNEFNAGPGLFSQAVAVAVERKAMLAGGAARLVRIGVPGNFGLQPSHLEGPPPSAGTPNTYVAQVSVPSGYRVWSFAVDWTNPGASTLTLLPFVQTPAFDSSVLTVPQASPGEALAALSGSFLMYRAQFRQFNGYESIVLNHTINAGGGRAGIRWAELRNTGAGWALFQVGTHAPSDGLHRWMGSIAQDRNGDIALGYSASGTTQAADVRYVSRTAADPLGTLPGGEITLQAGLGVQVSSSGRWGDYSAMSADPFPDCTFWYTQEYYANTGSFDFKTHVGSFAFPGCGPSLLLKLNGDAGEVVHVPPSQFEVTLAGRDGGSVAPMDWFYAVFVGGTLFWLTPSGFSLTPAPILSGVPPADFPDTVIWNTPLPSGTTATFVLFVSQGGTVKAFDYITGVVS